MRFLRPCAKPGCSKLVYSGRCEAHQTKEKRVRTTEDYAKDRTERGSASARGYDSGWRRLRAYHLAHEPLCRQCLEEKRVTPAFVVDHIVPIREGGARLDRENLQSLCVTCHNRKTALESRRRREERRGG